MQPSNEMLEKLRTMASANLSSGAWWVLHHGNNNYTSDYRDALLKAMGRRQLAKEILEDLARGE